VVVAAAAVAAVVIMSMVVVQEYQILRILIVYRCNTAISHT